MGRSGIRSPVIQDFKELANEWSGSKVSEVLSSHSGDIERIRPFLGEYLWSLYFSYRAFSFRLAIFIRNEHDKSNPKYWKNDDLIKELLNIIKIGKIKDCGGAI